MILLNFGEKLVVIIFAGSLGLKKCHRLWEYSEFVSEIEPNKQSGKSRDEAVQSAMNCCIEQGILTALLKSEKSEVLRMIFSEYDEKKTLKAYL